MLVFWSLFLVCVVSCLASSVQSNSQPFAATPCSLSRRAAFKESTVEEKPSIASPQVCLICLGQPISGKAACLHARAASQAAAHEGLSSRHASRFGRCPSPSVGTVSQPSRLMLSQALYLLDREATEHFVLWRGLRVFSPITSPSQRASCFDLQDF